MMIWRVKRFFRKLKRVWDFIPIIWKGDDYDYQYSIDLFKYQLDRTADYIQDRGLISDADNVASRIRTATHQVDSASTDHTQCRATQPNRFLLGTCILR